MARARRTRILIVDDSAVMRGLLRSVVSADPTLEVAGTAADGVSALEAISSSRPDLILLDVEMPNLDGLATLRALRQRSRAPVIMVSATIQRGARVTIEALASGASDYVAKPTQQADRESALRSLAQELLPKIQALTGSSVPVAPAPISAREMLTRTQAGLVSPAVVVVGVSTGGPVALEVLLSAMPPEFPLPVLLVQHMPELFTGMLVERLAQRCPIRIREGSESAPVLPGTVYLARGNWHMEVQAGSDGSPKLHLHQGPLQSHCRPSVDVLFRSAGEFYGASTLAVVMTGMGSDGLAGCRTIFGLGGTILAQDQATSAVWGMPGAVTEAGLAQRVLPLPLIGPEILRLTGRAAPKRELRKRVAP